jgi:archaellum component FlaF (FlaF/FlaG flagellin family)
MALGSNLSVNGLVLDPNSIALPCGLIAKYRFNDTFKITLANNGSQRIHIDENNIALEADRKHKFNTATDKAN